MYQFGLYIRGDFLRKCMSANLPGSWQPALNLVFLQPLGHVQMAQNFRRIDGVVQRVVGRRRLDLQLPHGVAQREVAVLLGHLVIEHPLDVEAPGQLAHLQAVIPDVVLQGDYVVVAPGDKSGVIPAPLEEIPHDHLKRLSRPDHLRGDLGEFLHVAVHLRICRRLYEPAKRIQLIKFFIKLDRSEFDYLFVEHHPVALAPEARVRIIEFQVKDYIACHRSASFFVNFLYYIIFSLCVGGWVYTSLS